MVYTVALYHRWYEVTITCIIQVKADSDFVTELWLWIVNGCLRDHLVSTWVNQCSNFLMSWIY